MKRIALFIITNLAIVILLGIIMSIFGISSKSIPGMLLIAFVFGMGGSFVSLAISKWIAKRSTGAVVIETPSNNTERWLIETVKKQADQAGIGMPEVAIYDAPDANAFATGMKRNDALVAVSTGLLEEMTQDEVEAVLAHEVSHIANGDMITMALMQGVLNTFVIFAARLIASAIDSVMGGDDGEGGLGFFAHMAVVIVAELVLGALASIIVMWYSRKREYHADAGAAKLVGKQKMIAALERLKAGSETAELPGELAAFGISNTRSSLSDLLSTHPTLESRIDALKAL